MSDRDEHDEPALEKPRSTAPPPMSQDDYETLVRSTPAPPTSSSGPAGLRTDSLVRISPAPDRRRVAETAPSRRASDPAIAYAVGVPRAPLVPALSIPGFRAISAPPPADLELALVLRHEIPAREVRGFDLDARAGFVLSLIDGKATVEDICDMCPFGEAETVAILGLLVARGVLGPA